MGRVYGGRQRRWRPLKVMKRQRCELLHEEGTRRVDGIGHWATEFDGGIGYWVTEVGGGIGYWTTDVRGSVLGLVISTKSPVKSSSIQFSGRTTEWKLVLKDSSPLLSPLEPIVPSHIFLPAHSTAPRDPKNSLSVRWGFRVLAKSASADCPTSPTQRTSRLCQSYYNTHSLVLAVYR